MKVINNGIVYLTNTESQIQKNIPYLQFLTLYHTIRTFNEP